MDGRQFLGIARALLQENDEESWRTAANRAYYGVFIECRDALLRWGVKSIPVYQPHARVKLLFAQPSLTDLYSISQALESLYKMRCRADYDTATVGPFHSHFIVEQAVIQAEQTVDLLDDIEADPSRKAAAVAAVLAVP
jgi:hypothetical protein